MSSNRFILVTGATGFIGAHVVDELLRRGFRVRATTRSVSKGEVMRQARPQAGDRLEFAAVGDLTAPNGFDEAVKGVDGIIHCAAPVATSFEDGERDVIIPAIEGTKAILNAAGKESKVRRIVMTSSFATLIDVSRGWDPTWTYTAEQWNPLTYNEARLARDIRAYRGAKKFSELHAWDFVHNQKPHFDLVTLIPPMVFGPIVHPVAEVSKLNMSNLDIWNIAAGQEYPEQRVPVWVDVRDLAVAHVEALLRPEASNRRFTVASLEKFSHQRIADIIRQEFDWGKDTVKKGDEGAPLKESFNLDGATATSVLGVTYRPFRDCVVESVSQFKQIAQRT